MSDGRRLVVKAKRAFSSKISCFVRGHRVSVTVFQDVNDLEEAERIVATSFGPCAKNLDIKNVSIEKHY